MDVKVAEKSIEKTFEEMYSLVIPESELSTSLITEKIKFIDDVLKIHENINPIGILSTSSLEKRFYKSIISMRCLFDDPSDHILSHPCLSEVFLQHSQYRLTYGDVKSFITENLLPYDFIDIYSIFTEKPKGVYFMTTKESSQFLQGIHPDYDLTLYTTVAIPLASDDCIIVIHNLEKQLKFYAPESKPHFSQLKSQISSTLKITHYFSQLITIENHQFTALNVLHSLIHPGKPVEFLDSLEFKESILKDLIAY